MGRATGDGIAFDVLVDTNAPKLHNSAVSIYEEDGRTWLEGTFEDDGSLASVEIFPQVKRSYNTQNNPYADPNYFEYGMDKNNPFYTEMIYDADVQEWTFRCDITEYAHTNESYSGENYYYNFDWTGNIFIFGGDYGGNDRGYAVTVNTDPGLVLSTTSARLYVGDTFELNILDNTGDDLPITRSSEKSEVASIDEYGIITAVAPGLVLDGPGFCTNGVSWSGKLVALPGYELPSEIKVCTRYDYGYESEMSLGGYYNSDTYDSTTGTIDVNYETKNAAFYTLSQPGISYMTATSSDGQHSIRFAVICEGVRAEKLEPDTKSMTLEEGKTAQLNVTLTPEPTLQEDQVLMFTSFNEDVALVDENGVVTAVAPGYAYVKIALASNTRITGYCGVEATASDANLAGTVTSYGDAEAPVTVTLWKDGQEVKTVTALNGTYRLNAEPGSYQITFSKENHVSRSYNITVDSDPVIQDGNLCLLGDVNGDGQTDIADSARLYAHVMGTNPLTDEYAMSCADVVADGDLDIGDTGRLYAHVRDTPPLY